MIHHEIVKKLIGSIRPAGESHIDEVRLANLKEFITLTEALVMDIQDMVFDNKDKREASIVSMVKEGEYFLNRINS